MNPWKYVGRHRAERPANTQSNPLRFTPRHCGGTTCLHNHHDDTRPRIPLWKWSA